MGSEKLRRELFYLPSFGTTFLIKFVQVSNAFFKFFLRVLLHCFLLVFVRFAEWRRKRRIRYERRTGMAEGLHWKRRRGIHFR